MTSRARVLGLSFDRLTQDSLVDRIGELLVAGGEHWVLTANVQHLGVAAHDPAARAAFQRADVVTADGMPIVWASRLLGDPLPGRVTGSDLLLPLARRSAEKGWRLFLAGGAPGVADKVAERLVDAAPGLQIAGTAAPPQLELAELVASEDGVALRAAIRASRADVLLMALGSPKQELWIAQHCGELGVGVAIGVGASFDFLVGNQNRAPAWARRVGIEWLYRAMTSPRRLVPRYARNGLTLVWLLAREWWRRLSAPR